jgi:hypothetical protein
MISCAPRSARSPPAAASTCRRRWPRDLRSGRGPARSHRRCGSRPASPTSIRIAPASASSSRFLTLLKLTGGVVSLRRAAWAGPSSAARISRAHRARARGRAPADNRPGSPRLVGAGLGEALRGSARQGAGEPVPEQGVGRAAARPPRRRSRSARPTSAASRPAGAARSARPAGRRRSAGRSGSRFRRAASRARGRRGRCR